MFGAVTSKREKLTAFPDLNFLIFFPLAKSRRLDDNVCVIDREWFDSAPRMRARTKCEGVGERRSLEVKSKSCLRKHECKN